MRHFICIYLTFFSVNCFAETVQLRIREKGTGDPLKRVEVKFNDQVVYSDSKGDVLIDSKTKEVPLVIYKAGFEKYITNLANLVGLDPIEVFLLPSQPDDEVIVVSGVKRPETSKKVISVEEAKKISPRGDPVQVIKLLPGVQSGAFGSQVIIRGSGPEDTLYYIDDWAVPYIFHNVGQISIVPPQIINDIEFSSGGFGAQYGSATGGIIAARTSNTIPDKDRAEFRFNLPLYSSVFYQMPFGEKKDQYIAISARRSYLEFFLKQILSDDQSNTTITPYFGDTQLLWQKNTDDGHWKALFFTSFDGLKLQADFEQSNNEDGRGKFEVEQSIYTLGLERQKSLSKNWRMKTSSQISYYGDSIEILDLYFKSNQRRFRNKTEFTLRRGRKENTYLGFEAEHVNFDVSVRLPQPDLNDPFFDFEDAPVKKASVASYDCRGDIWASHEMYFEPVQLTPGLRVYYDKLLDKYSADPRFATRYEINKDNTAKFAIGQYSQLPNYRDTSADFGNPDLDWILAHHYVLGLETKWSEKWDSDMQLFYKRRFKLIRSDSEKKTDNDGSGYNYGFEAFVRRNLTARLFAWLSYTYSINKDRPDDQTTFHNAEYDQTHILNLVGNYKFSAEWEVGGRFKYNTGDTYNSVDDATYNANLDKYQQKRFANSKPNNKRLPAYHEASIFAGRNYLYDTWKLEMRFGVEFLALKPQAQDVQYNYDYSKEEFFTGVPPIPYFEIGGIF